MGKKETKLNREVKGLSLVTKIYQLNSYAGFGQRIIILP